MNSCTESDKQTNTWLNRPGVDDVVSSQDCVCGGSSHIYTFFKDYAIKQVRTGNYTAASKLYELAWRTTTCVKHPHQASTAAQVKVLQGLCLERLNQLGAAWTCYRRAFYLFTSSHQLGCFNCYTCAVIFHVVSRLCGVLHKRGDSTLALNLINHVVLLSTRTTTDATVLINSAGVRAEFVGVQATILQDLGDYENAEQVLLYLRGVYANYPFSSKDTGRNEASIGHVYFLQKRYTDALVVYVRAISHLMSYLPDTCPSVLPVVLHNTATVLNKLNRSVTLVSKLKDLARSLDLDFVSGNNTFVKKLVGALAELNGN